MTIGVLVAGVLAGGIAAVSGFAIGSLLTPILAVRYGTKLAVAIVSVPHLVGTAARFIGCAFDCCVELKSAHSASSCYSLVLVLGIYMLIHGVTTNA
jgi:hypothetical protein